MVNKRELRIASKASLLLLLTVIVVLTSCNNPVNDYLRFPQIKLLGGTLTIGADEQFDFGYVEALSSGKEVIFVVKNIGNVEMNLQDIVTISGVDAGYYQITEALSKTVLPAGGSATFEVTFNPSSVGVKSATVTVQCNDPDTPEFVFTIIGTGVATGDQPEIALTQGGTTYESDSDVYDFLNITSGYASSAVTFTITNQGGVDLTVSSITISDDVNYTLDAPTTPLTIPVFNSETFDVTFNPTTTGSKDTTVVILNNDPTDDENTFILKITGNGIAPVPEISVLQSGSPYESNATPYDFGTLPEGVTGDPVTFTIRNDGTGDLTVTSVSLGDTNNFELTPPSVPFTLTPTATRDFTAAFSPNGTSTYNSSIAIASDDGDEPIFYLKVTGDGEIRETIFVSSTSPANGASDVRIDGNITITFDKGIDPLTITGTTIKQGAVNYSYTSSYDGQSKTLTLNPNSDLQPQTSTTVTLPTGITGYNYELFGGYNFSFTTGTAWHDGNTIFVSTTGTAGSPGTKAQPVKSIQEGVDKAAAQGYTQVYVRTGTYSFSNGGLEPSPTAGVHITNPVTIIGGWNSTFTAYSTANSTLDAEGNCDHVVFIQSSDVNLEYLTITGGNADGTDDPDNNGGGILLYNTSTQRDITVTNVIVEYNSATGDGAGIYMETRSKDVTFMSCDVRNNTGNTYVGGGFRIIGSENVTLDDVNIQDNTGEGISTMYTYYLTIDNCFVSNNSGVAGIYMWGGSYTTLYLTYIRQSDYCLYLNSNSAVSDPHPHLEIDRCNFASTAGSTTAVAVKEGQSDVNGHTFTNNDFLPNYLGYLYEDWDGTKTPDTAAGLTIMNTAGHADHDASPASGNELRF